MFLYNTGVIGMVYDTLDDMLPDWANDYPVVGIASGGDGNSKLFMYNGTTNTFPGQTVVGPNGKLDPSQLFFVPVENDYTMLNIVANVSYQIAEGITPPAIF
ncbi:MAG: hypothetical protein RR817_03240 [Niameybacter sp.]